MTDPANRATRLGDCVHRADFWIEVAPAAVAIGGEREASHRFLSVWAVLFRFLDADDRGVAGARSGERVGANAGVVLFGDPAL